MPTMMKPVHVELHAYSIPFKCIYSEFKYVDFVGNIYVILVVNDFVGSNY